MADPAPLPAPESLTVLMIALSDSVLVRWGDTQERHIEYAERINHLHMIAHAPRGKGHPAVVTLSEKLTVYPTNSRAKPLFIPDAVRIGANIARHHPVDVITTQGPHTSGLIGVLLKRRLGVPLDVQNHSDFFDNREWISEKPLRYGAFNRLGKWVIRQGDTHRVLNVVEKAKYTAMGIPPDRVEVLSTPTRLGRFTPGPADPSLRARLGIPPGAPVLLWVGRPVKFKRVPTLLEAFAQVHTTHPEAQLVLVGDFSTYCPQAIEQAAALGVASCVHFAGLAPHEDLPAYYRLCDIYVHSSVYEGLGKVMIEAASTAKPVVSTRTAGAGEIVRDGETGLLCEPENPTDMAAKIRTLLDNPARARAMGEAGRRFVRGKFDHTRNLDAVITTWQRAVAVGPQ